MQNDPYFNTISWQTRSMCYILMRR